jgi:ABC-2 type transport system ATP-binding protein
MRALIRSLAHDDGVTVVLASHQLQEVQRVCDRVAILHRGRLVREGAVSELTASGEQLRLSVKPAEQVLGILGTRGSRDGTGILANVPRAEGPALIRALVEAGIEIDEARWVGADLESVFFTETGSVRAPEAPHAG